MHFVEEAWLVYQGQSAVHHDVGIFLQGGTIPLQIQTPQD
jgi:hypothetical protein